MPARTAARTTLPSHRSIATPSSSRSVVPLTTIDESILTHLLPPSCHSNRNALPIRVGRALFLAVLDVADPWGHHQPFQSQRSLLTWPIVVLQVVGVCSAMRTGAEGTGATTVDETAGGGGYGAAVPSTPIRDTGFCCPPAEWRPHPFPLGPLSPLSRCTWTTQAAGLASKTRPRPAASSGPMAPTQVPFHCLFTALSLPFA